MSLTNIAENAILDELLGSDGASIIPDPFWVGVSSTAPAEDGTNFTEPSGNNYGRASVANSAANWPAASGSQKSNGTVISFLEATGDWVGGSPLTHFGIFDAVSGGNLILFGSLTTPKTIGLGDTLRFNTDELVVTAD